MSEFRFKFYEIEPPDRIRQCVIWMIIFGALILFMAIALSGGVRQLGPNPFSMASLLHAPISSYLLAKFSRRRLLHLGYGCLLGSLYILALHPPRWAASPLWFPNYGLAKYAIQIFVVIAGLGFGCPFAASLRPPLFLDYPACAVCRYNLTGNESGVCPECGTVLPNSLKQAHP